MAKIDVYNLGLRGVVVDKSAVHTTDGELLLAQNWQIDSVGGRGAIRRRDGMVALNALPLAGPVLGGIGVPLPDRSTLRRVFYLALNDGLHAFLVSDDGVAWSATSTFPAVPVREVTLGVDTLHPVFGDAAMIWRGVGGTLYYPANDYANGGPSLPSVHAWNNAEDIPIARVPPNPADAGNTFGAFGITSIVPYGATQLLVAVADRTSGRARVLSLDIKNGALSQLGAGTDLASGHIIGGIVVWQGRVWIAGANVSAGGPLVTRWIRPGDASWTTDDSFSTTHGYCTGLCVFKGELYQSSAADAGSHGFIRKRRQAAGGSATRTTSVLGGSTTVAIGGPTTVVGAVAGGAGAIPVADTDLFLLLVGAASVSGQTINYTGRTLAVVPAPVVTPNSGAGMGAGQYQYVVTNRTAIGESLPSAVATVVTGTLAAPVAAPTAGAATVGGSLDAGTHDYGLTFVTAAGETTLGPVSAAITAGPVTSGGTAAPGSAPSPGTPATGTGPDAGSHEYATTFLTAIGETDLGAISAPVSVPGVTTLSPPSSAPSLTPNYVDPSFTMDPYNPGVTVGVCYTFVNAAGETTPSPAGSVTLTGPASFISVPLALGGTGTIARRLYRSLGGGAFGFMKTVNNNTASFDSVQFQTPGSAPPSVNTATIGTPQKQVPLTGIPTGPAGVTGRRLYRRFNGSGAFNLVTTFNENGVTTYTDTVPNSSLGGAAPTSNTTGIVTQYRTIPLTALPTGGPLVTSRNLYRRFNGAGVYRLVASLPASGSTWSDALANATAGAAPPSSNTAITHQVALSSLPVAPAGATNRLVYRTIANGTQFKLLGYIDTTSPTLLDAAPDSALLNVFAPTIDTSGLPKPGTLTGVTGLGSGLASGVPITPAVPIGATALRVADVASLLVPGAVAVSGQTVRYTGRSVTSGPGELTGVTGIAAVILHGAAVVLSVPAGATAVPVGDTTNFSSAGGAAQVGIQAITYTGRTTTSGPGVLTGVTGLSGAAIVGTAVAVLVPPAAVWSIAYMTDGNGAGNSVGPMIVTADGGTILAFRNSVSGGTAPMIVILRSVDGVVWVVDFSISNLLSNEYGRSGMPLLDPDSDGDIYWPLASGSSGAGKGGLLKRSAAGAWSVVLSNLPNVRGPLGIVRVEGGE